MQVGAVHSNIKWHFAVFNNTLYFPVYIAAGVTECVITLVEIYKTAESLQSLHSNWVIDSSHP